MNQVNATVDINPQRLNFPLPTLHAKQLHSFVAEIRNIPDDSTSAVLRLFRTDRQSHFEIPISRNGGGSSTGIAYIVGTCFPDAGHSFYEIHAYDAHGNCTAFGNGSLDIGTFTATGAPIEPGQSVPVMQITDAGGALHTIMAVSDGEGGFTTIIDGGSDD